MKRKLNILLFFASCLLQYSFGEKEQQVLDAEMTPGNILPVISGCTEII